MKSIFLATLLLFQVLTVHSQKPQVSWGPELSGSTKCDMDRIMGHSGDAFYTLRKNPNNKMWPNYTVECYDTASMNLVYSREVQKDIKLKMVKENPMEVINQNIKIQSVIMIKDYLYLLFTYYSFKENSKILYASPISLKDGSQNSPLVKLDEIDNLKDMEKGEFSYLVSGDTSNFVVFHFAETDTSKSNYMFAKVYSADMQMLWKKQLPIKKEKGNLALLNFRVDNEKQCYFMIKHLDVDERESRSVPNFYFEIIGYRPATDKVVNYQLEFGNRFITQIHFGFSSDSTLLCSGFYSENSKSDKNGSLLYNSAKGTFFLKLNKNLEAVTQLKSYAFDQNIISQAVSNPQKAESVDELRNFWLRTFIYESNGGLLMFSEQMVYSIAGGEDAKRPIFTNPPFFHTNNIIANRYDKDGEMIWTKVITKRQKTTPDDIYLGSFTSLINRNEVFMLYNEHEDNVSLTTMSDAFQVMDSPKKSVVVMVKLLSDGSIIKSPLFDNRELGLVCRPSMAYQVEYGKAFVFVEKGSKYRFGKITY